VAVKDQPEQILSELVTPCSLGWTPRHQPLENPTADRYHEQPKKIAASVPEDVEHKKFPTKAASDRED
jgi:hypothetical protein